MVNITDDISCSKFTCNCQQHIYSNASGSVSATDTTGVSVTLLWGVLGLRFEEKKDVLAVVTKVVVLWIMLKRM
jgi:hypothetical protein